MLRLGDDRDLGDLARRGGVVGGRAVDDRHVLVEIERLDEIRIALVQVDSSGMRGAMARRLVDCAQQTPGVPLDQSYRAAARGADVSTVAGTPSVGPVPPAGSSAQESSAGQTVHARARGRYEHLEVLLGQWRLLGGRAQVWPEH